MRRHLAATLALATFGCFLACSDDDGPGRIRDGGLGTAETGAPDAPRSADAAPDAHAEPPIFVGNPCDSDEHCLPPAKCFRSSDRSFHAGSAVGAPPNGICSVDCNSFSDATVCSRTQSPSTCVEVGEADSGIGACLLTCTVGDADRGKCLSRTDTACVPERVGDLEGRCLPFCEGDYQCAEGRCDLGSGLCVSGSSPVGRAPVGADCQYDWDCTSDLCLQVDSARFCSGFCGLGGISCGTEPLSSDPIDSACLFPTSGLADYGDLGFCGQLCDCDGDCRHPLARCVPFFEEHPIRRAARGRNGYCTFPPEDVEHLTCATADAGAVDSGADASDPGDASSTRAPDASSTP